MNYWEKVQKEMHSRDNNANVDGNSYSSGSYGTVVNETYKEFNVNDYSYSDSSKSYYVNPSNEYVDQAGFEAEAEEYKDKNDFETYDYTQNEFKQESYGQNEYSQNGYAQDSYSQREYSQSSYSQGGYAQDSYSQRGYSKTSYDQNGYGDTTFNGTNLAQNRESYQSAVNSVRIVVFIAFAIGAMSFAFTAFNMFKEFNRAKEEMFINVNNLDSDNMSFGYKPVFFGGELDYYIPEQWLVKSSNYIEDSGKYFKPGNGMVMYQEMIFSDFQSTKEQFTLKITNDSYTRNEFAASTKAMGYTLMNDYIDKAQGVTYEIYSSVTSDGNIAYRVIGTTEDYYDTAIYTMMYDFKNSFSESEIETFIEKFYVGLYVD